MKVAILGAGNVGRTLGTGLAAAGHEILYAVREPDAPKNAALPGPHSRALPVRDAVAAADAVVLTTPWNAAEAALASAGDFGGKPLLDATNPIGPGFVLTHGHTDSGAEQVQRWAPSAKVVKAFNTTGVENMADPRYGDAKAVMLVAGDDADACAVALRLADELGFEAIRVGGLARARMLEPMAALWITLAMSPAHGRNIAFGLLRRAAPA